MDIKGIVNSVLPFQVRAKENVERAIKTDSTTDRDANGQQSSGSGQDKRRPMTDEELKKAMDHLKQLAVVKDHNLLVTLVESENKKFILLQELGGKVLRRISEPELWSLIEAKTNDRGQLLSKTA